MKQIDRWLFNPIPRGATFRVWNDFHLTPRFLYAHQLFYVFKGDGEGMLDGRTFPLAPGLLAIYGPGCRHAFTHKGKGLLEMGMVCFSVNETDERKRALGNAYVTAIGEDYWKMADEPIAIEGVPPLPICMNLTGLPWRLEFENTLRSVGTAWSTHFTVPLVYQVKSLLSTLFFHLTEEWQRLNATTEEPHIVSRVIRYVEREYAHLSDRGEVARHLRVSESYLTTLLRKYRQTNFSTLLEKTKLAAAKEFLQYSDNEVAEIASLTGFSSPSYFTTRFKKAFGVTPRQFRLGQTVALG